ncbi:MAG TPA: hypothetical protein ENI95_04705 [Chloroflexi bacterium]|nr:hypothetical protein [Chloroflexota bacterium]
MSFTMQRLPDEPILIVTRFDAVPSDLPDIFRLSLELKKEIEGTVYRIHDLSRIDLDFSTMVEGMANASAKCEGSMRDSRFRDILVGSHELIQLASAAFQQKQYGGLTIPLFESLEEAVEYARLQIGAANRSLEKEAV